MYMTSPTLITEHSAKLRERSGSKWRVAIITPGVGSSATYTEEILARDAATAWPKGTKLWFGHPKEGEGPGDRDARDQWGVLENDAFWSEEDQEVQGDVRVFEHWAPVVNSIGEDAELSIYAWAERDENGVATALLRHRTNSVDMVSYAGRPGSGLSRKIEAAREAARKPGVTSAQEKEDDMDEKAVEALVKRLLGESLEPVIAFVNESKANKATEAQAKVDAEAVDAAVEERLGAYEAACAAIEAAELLDPQVKDLKARARKGEDITEAIKSAKEIVEAADKRAEEKLDESGFAGRIADTNKPKDAAGLTEGLGW